jgi:hypothetical protein
MPWSTMLPSMLHIAGPLVRTFLTNDHFLQLFLFIQGWRPTFKYYNMWLSLITCIACLAFMFSLDWMSAIIVFCLAGVVMVVHSARP